MIRYCAVFVTLLGLLCCKHSDAGHQSTPPPLDDTTLFRNPLLSSGPDPWVAGKDGYYYYLNTKGDGISLRKTKDLSKLKDAAETTVWKSVEGTAYSNDVWAPELHYLQGKWYIYFTADSAGIDATHRLYVLENQSGDPTTGTWEFKGKISDASDHWAIDGSVLEYNGRMYLVWSGWKNEAPGNQQLYIAKLANPWTIDGSRVMISEPDLSWERNGFPVNEGPEALTGPGGRLFITYSASFCGTDEYCLGLLSLKENGDPLRASDWQKSDKPVFTKNVSGKAFGPGHNGFFVSPDGQQNWMIYHANSSPGQGCGDARNPRMQPFSWNAEGRPVFGSPAPLDSALRRP